MRGNGRLAQTPLPAGEPWGKYAVSTARWTGAQLYQVLAQARPAASGVEVIFEGADHGRYYQYEDISFVRSLALAHAADPAAGILIAYEMNGAPLQPDHGAPFRLIMPNWYGVASVKWLKRIDVSTEPYEGEFQTGHYMYEWPDQPREPVTLMRVRARITDPAPRSSIPARHLHHPRQGLDRHRPRDQRRGQPHRRRRLAPRRARAPGGPVPVAGLVLRLACG